VDHAWYVSEEGEDDVEDKVATTSSHHQNRDWRKDESEEQSA